MCSKDVEAIRTILGVPILKGDQLLGVMMIYHLEVRPFADNQIALVETFADQAAIAIENVRLFEAEQQRARENARLLNELRERTVEVERLNQQLEQRVTDQVDEIERMSRLRRFLPPQVAHPNAGKGHNLYRRNVCRRILGSLGDALFKFYPIGFYTEGVSDLRR